eukprot:TRINITY_DN8490_c0_g1_i2.p1 TRINITY_DN8490_c0_g1~~TRINITY_DN8490_c0_g1_i2.p1  ORF type:complete len:547 (-),score=191.49 TRINITY_DN8490_c0_g1_i2:440-2035(-)
MATTDSEKHVIGHVDDFTEGQMKEVEIGENKALIIKQAGKLYATSTKCTHFGAPLKNGVLSDGRIRCQWHGACFSIATGDIEDFPGLDSLQSHQLDVDAQGVVTLTASAKALSEPRRVVSHCTRSPADARVFVLVGGGCAAAVCAETLRHEGFTGRIVLISKEKFAPYDRTKLSKAMTSSGASIVLRPESFYAELQIELVLGRELVELDAQEHTVKLDDGSVIVYDKALVAPGAAPRWSTSPGSRLGGIHALRNPDDALAIVTAAEGKDVVVVGSSFIGMEVASSIVKKAKSVTVVGMESVPFERVFGVRIGAALQKLHEKNGVQFRLGRSVQEFKGDEAEQIASVHLDNGEALPAGLAIMAIGVVPATSFVRGVTTERDGTIVVDEHMQAAEGLYAAGDACRFPDFLTNELVNVQHWGMAHYHGKIAGQNMAGKTIASVHNVPFFWTTQFGKSLRYCGRGAYDDVIFDGNPEELTFVAYFTKDGRVVSAASCGRDPVVSAVAELLQHRRMPSPSELSVGGVDLVKLAASV